MLLSLVLLEEFDLEEFPTAIRCPTYFGIKAIQDEDWTQMPL